MPVRQPLGLRSLTLLALYSQAVFFATGVSLLGRLSSAAHRFFNAATMFARPALLSVRLGFDGAVLAAGAGEADSPRILAHRSCWASFMRRRTAAERFLRSVFGPSSVAAVSAGPPESSDRSSVICRSIRAFCASNPSMAAVTISAVNFACSRPIFNSQINALNAHGDGIAYRGDSGQRQGEPLRTERRNAFRPWRLSRRLVSTRMLRHSAIGYARTAAY